VVLGKFLKSLVNPHWCLKRPKARSTRSLRHTCAGRHVLVGRVEKELDHEKFLDLLEEVQIHVIDMLIRFLTRKNPKSPDRAGRVKKLLNPLRTQVRAVRFGTPPDFEDGLVEVRNRRLGSVILSYHQLVALMAQAKDGRHFTQLVVACI
jgi:hypothetical protein